MNGREDLKSYLKAVATIRFFEEKVAELYPRGLIRCPVHLAIGHEGAAVGVCRALSMSDRVFSYHRSHHHFLAMNGDAKSLLYELMGDPRGCSGGRGGSTHLYSPQTGFMGSTAIISGVYPVATGFAHSMKMSRSDGLVVCFGGDASIEEGVFFESLNLANLWSLPLLVVIEDNDLSCYTSRSARQSHQSFESIAQMFSIPFADVDGVNPQEVHDQTLRLTKLIRENQKPALLRVRVFRAHEHCGPDRDDGLTYRKVKGEWPEKDPLLFLRNAIEAQEAARLLEEIQIENRQMFSSVLKELGHDENI